MTDSWSFGVVLCDVLAERFVTKDGEKPAVGDAAKGLRAFTSESKNVSVTGVNLLLAPQPRDGFKSDSRPSDDGVRADAETTSKQRQADVLVERLLSKAHLVELLLNGIL